jgi:hypothetical protein
MKSAMMVEEHHDVRGNSHKKAVVFSVLVVR